MNPVAPVTKYAVIAVSSRGRTRAGDYFSAHFDGHGLRVTRLVGELRGRADARAEDEGVTLRTRSAEAVVDLEAPAGRRRRVRERLVVLRARRAALDDHRRAPARHALQAAADRDRAPDPRAPRRDREGRGRPSL